MGETTGSVCNSASSSSSATSPPDCAILSLLLTPFVIPHRPEKVCCSTPYQDVPSLSSPPSLSHQEVDNLFPLPWFQETPSLVGGSCAHTDTFTEVMSRDRLSTAKHCCFDMVKIQKCIFKGLEIPITESLTARAEPGSEHPHGCRLALHWFYQDSTLPSPDGLDLSSFLELHDSSIPPLTALSCSPEA